MLLLRDNIANAFYLLRVMNTYQPYLDFGFLELKTTVAKESSTTGYKCTERFTYGFSSKTKPRLYIPIRFKT